MPDENFIFNGEIPEGVTEGEFRAAIRETLAAHPPLTHEQIEAEIAAHRATLPPLNSDAVREIVADCLFRDEELAGLEPGKAPKDAIMVQGIVCTMGFHSGRIAGNADKIAALLAELPDDFQKSKGGGMSFLQACMDRHGNQWTGFHQLMEQLFLIGIAAGKVEWCAPRELWSVLPGGVPYVVVLDQ